MGINTDFSPLDNRGLLLHILNHDHLFFHFYCLRSTCLKTCQHPLQRNLGTTTEFAEKFGFLWSVKLTN